jgi:hypothetical protein
VIPESFFQELELIHDMPQILTSLSKDPEMVLNQQFSNRSKQRVSAVQH